MGHEPPARLLVDDRPTSVESFAGSPISSSSIAPASSPITRSAMSSWTNSTRAAEQRCPAELNALAIVSRTSCSASAEAVGDDRVLAAGFGDQGRDRPVARGKRPVDRARRLGRASEDDAGDARIGDERAAHRRPVTGQELKHGFRYAGLVQKAHCAVGDERRLLGGFGDHRVAGHEGGAHLSGEDRERKIPRTDRGEHAAAAKIQFVRFAGRAGKRLRGAEEPPPLRCVIAKIVHRLA
ncbi:MAG: hypothetical protein RML56_00205 [Burkholderiales bacterium]|nr:hypothetical protein [Burkholderiales bacterium]